MHQKIVTALLLVVVLGGCYMIFALNNVLHRVQEIDHLTIEDVRDVMKGIRRMQLYTKWQSGKACIEHQVCTTQREGESEQEHEDRHDAIVARRQDAHPPKEM